MREENKGRKDDRRLGSTWDNIGIASLSPPMLATKLASCANVEHVGLRL